VGALGVGAVAFSLALICILLARQVREREAR